MNIACKRMTASLLAFALVAGIVPANVNWEDALWDTSIVAKAANHTASGLRSISTSANQWYSDDSNTTALNEVNGGAALLNNLHIAIMNADDYLDSIYDDASSLDQNGEEIYTTLETAFNAAKAALNGDTQTAPTVTTAPSALNPTYSGSAQALVSAGTASGDETHFSKLESVEYTIKGAKFSTGNTVSFKEKVEFNFLVEATDVDTVEGAYVVFTYDHYGTTTTVKKPINKSDKNGKYYRVRLPLTASEMAIDIKAELYLPTLDKPVDTKTRSIKDYAESAIKSNLDGADVLKAMLNYGGYTQTALGNNTTLLANSGEGIAVDVSAVSPKSATPFVRPTVTGAKVTYKGSTVITTSDVFVRHYFTVATTLTTAELNAVKIQVGDKVLALKDLPKNNTGYYYDVAPQLAYELDKENDSVVVYGFSGAETADSENAINIENYNVIDYCEAIANNANQSAANKNMVKALYAYYKAAKAYVDKRA